MFLTLIIAIISFLPEVIKAQELKVAAMIAGDYQRGFVFGPGISLSDYSNQEISMDAYITWSYPGTSFGLNYIIRPIKGKAGQVFGVGFDALYFYKSRLSAKSFAQNGANGSSLLTDPYAKWQTTRIAVIPSLQIAVPIKNCRLGFVGQPFAFISWHYDAYDKSWSQWKQYYSFYFFLSWHLSSYIDMDIHKDENFKSIKVYDTASAVLYTFFISAP